MFQRRHIEPRSWGIGRDAFDVQRLAFRTEAFEGDAANELMPMIDIEDQHAVPAEREIIADAGRGDVEKALPADLGSVSRDGGDELSEQTDHGQANHWGEFAA